MKTFADFGIHINQIKGSNQKTICPECSHTRKNGADPCLSVNSDEGVWLCHHCEWKGSLGNEKENGSVYYKLEDLENFFGENPVETDEEEKSMEGDNAYKRL